MQVKSTQEVLPAGHRDSKLVQSVGQRIVEALPKGGSDVEGYCGHLARYQWEFAVVKSNDVNAFVAPGGKVVVYTGALDHRGECSHGLKYCVAGGLASRCASRAARPDKALIARRMLAGCLGACDAGMCGAGLLDMVGRDADKLATVLGHEAAHVVARHSAEGVGLRALLGGAGWFVCSALKGLSAGATRSYRCAHPCVDASASTD